METTRDVDEHLESLDLTAEHNSSSTATAIEALLARREAAGMNESAWRQTVKVFHSSDLAAVMPFRDPRPGFPEKLQGLWWLDESGFYGCQTQSYLNPAGFITPVEGYVQSWGMGLLNLEKRKSWITKHGQAHPNSGGGWSRIGGLIPSFYIQWNSDYTYGVVKDYLKVWWWLTGPFLPLANIAQQVAMSMTIERQQIPKTCPLPDSASCEEKSKCAPYKRKLYAGPVGAGPFQNAYYVYQIVDGHGRKVQPYFDKWVEFANSRSKYSPQSETGKIKFHVEGVATSTKETSLHLDGSGPYV